jgi:8-oxo-dGTP pyrophosphatase MutT (NUDIX family)
VNRPVVDRVAVRALIITPASETLLMQIRSPNTGKAFWILPGGGLEDGESDEAGLRRELSEELSLDAFTLGPLIWLRQHTFDWRDVRYRQRERIYAVHAPRFAPLMRDDHERLVFQDFSWRPVSALAGFAEPLTPLSLARIATDYLRDGAPAASLEMEIVED